MMTHRMAHVFRPGRGAGWRGWMLAVLVWSAHAARGAEATNSEPSPKTTPPANAAATATTAPAPSGATGIAIWTRSNDALQKLQYDKKPILLDTSTGAFKGKTFAMMQIVDGNTVLCTDGTLISWGAYAMDRVPYIVPAGNMFAGRKISTISGPFVLCADGALYSWVVARTDAQQGSYSNTLPPGKFVPFARQFLAGKKVTSVVAWSNFGTAACSDGTRIAWGNNFHYQFGNGGKSGYETMLPPTKVENIGALFKKTITQLAMGPKGNPVLALTTDGTLVKWGYEQTNPEGRKPTVLEDKSELLKGKKISAIVTGGAFSDAALCADGTVAVWGGRLEKIRDPGTDPSKVAGALFKDLPPVTYPIAISNAGALTGKTVVAISYDGVYPGGLLLLCSDGTLGHWDGLGPPTAVNLKGLEKKTITFIAPGAVLYKDKEPPKP